ncbi:MAG: hypothetical protein UY72_C0017G0004 [Candidatus Uhrbacteria bacterium GW2011_GWD2_52_7]|uniref:Uncharacterized protein n=1 Tax=Candidatus Uhrbacteria bacterium GW2011_GWD2_52_7 TaxID=1618989 RepID=A0A0G1XH14_9BACT|nr:MAG: hypothetical protein UY72_C0017G0004 [Candidatus Uhrbacteria bacterium GW2011_GWD2_52_7]
MAKTSTRAITRVSTRTIVGVACLAAAAGTAAYGFATAGVDFSMAARRPITVARSAAAPNWGILLSSDSTEVAAFTLSNNTTEAISVRTVALDNCLSARDADGDCADAGEVNGNTSAVSLVTLTYEDSKGAAMSRTAPSGTSMGFGGIDIYIPASSSVDIQLNAELVNFGAAGIASGEHIQYNFDGVATSGFFAVGLTSGREYTEANVNATAMGYPITLRYTMPTFSLSSTSPSGPIIAGVNETLRFNVAAHSNGDVDFTGVTFKVSASDNDGTDWNSCTNFGDASKWELRDLSTGTTSSNMMFFDSTGASCTASANDLAYVVVRLEPGMDVVSAGAVSTYALYADSTGAGSSDSIMAEIPAQNSLRLGALSRLKSVEWTDGYSGSLNGNYVDNLPITGGTLTF